MKMIYFDMDGTIADLYSVKNWFSRLRDEDATPYLEARPMCDMVILSELLIKAKAQGYGIGIITWLSKGATKEYKKAVRQAKKQWLNNYLGVKLDEAHFIQYGTRKDYVAKDKKGILFDDDERVRILWKGKAYNPTEQNIIEVLQEIIK
jgi:phosphoglycolate phosphatase-like HAD superfamily hydrolase